MTLRGIKHTNSECWAYYKTTNLISLTSQWCGRKREGLFCIKDTRDIANKCNVWIGS